jgi:hypothetical protein
VAPLRPADARLDRGHDGEQRLVVGVERPV